MTEQTKVEPTKGAIIVVLVLVGLIALFFVSQLVGASNKADNGYTLDVASGEALAISSTRLAISKSAVDGRASIDEATCSTLSKLAKKLNTGASWFASCSSIRLGSNPDTSENQVMKLSDEKYCAIFTLDKGGKVLTGYKFTEGACGDSRIFVD